MKYKLIYPLILKFTEAGSQYFISCLVLSVCGQMLGSLIDCRLTSDDTSGLTGLENAHCMLPLIRRYLHIATDNGLDTFVLHKPACGIVERLPKYV